MGFHPSASGVMPRGNAHAQINPHIAVQLSVKIELLVNSIPDLYIPLHNLLQVLPKSTL
jgi:hypothetical protein